MINYYNGKAGALKFILDITDDYDGAKSVEALKELIDEVRMESFRALELGDDYHIKSEGFGENVL